MVTASIKSERVIPVIEIEDADKAAPLAEAMQNGGINILEITLRTPAALDAIKVIRSSFPDMLLGAGTVLTPGQANEVLQTGVDFGVSPSLNPDVVKIFGDKGLPFLPGVLSPTELEFAVKLGCDYLKFFPAGASGGPAFLKAISAPYANYGICFCATGGVTLDNMGDYLAVPLVNAIGGSWIATRQQIAKGDWDSIANQARQATSRLEAV